MVIDQVTLIQQMDTFLSEFRQHNLLIKQNVNNYNEMEKTIGEFTSFILDKKNEEIWRGIEQQNDDHLEIRIAELREQSAFSVWGMEKYRAIELQKNRHGIANYFSNIEACIETEFDSFEITSDSKVLLIGSGAFPMTPLLIAKKTGAEVVGIDIDPEAISLSRMIVDLMGEKFNITIEDSTVDQLGFTGKATHIVIASTIKEKFDILKSLHVLTNKNIVVAVRYGDGLKSLFNYPSQNVDSSLWNVAKNILHPENVFDTILYKKA
jgi:hypothetical protein